jgi:hypothetical protein
MTKFGRLAAAAVLGASALALMTTSASAAIACNADGDCWHVPRAYAYQAGWGVTVHPNNWRWGRGGNYRWREHAGRGYWRGGVWIGF